MSRGISSVLPTMAKGMQLRLQLKGQPTCPIQGGCGHPHPLDYSST